MFLKLYAKFCSLESKYNSTKKIEDERGQARYNSMGQGISQFEDWEVQEWDDDSAGGIEHLNN